MSVIYPPFLASEYSPQTKAQAFFHIYPVPLEKSVSYGGGTKDGPSALLLASQQLEAWEEELEPGKLGFYTAEPLDCSGDLKELLANLEAKVAETISLEKIPIILGGEHTVTLGALQAFAAWQNRSKPGIVQIDAHADLREAYEGNPYSHASVMYRAVADHGYQLLQMGMREYCREEVSQQKKFKVTTYTSSFLADKGWPDPLIPSDFPEDIYLTFDLDGLDASLMPATGTPSPGGFLWKETRQLIKLIAQSRRIVGFDVVELAPKPDWHFCDFTAAKLVHLLMAYTMLSQKN